MAAKMQVGKFLLAVESKVFSETLMFAFGEFFHISPSFAPKKTGLFMARFFGRTQDLRLESEEEELQELQRKASWPVEGKGN